MSTTTEEPPLQGILIPSLPNDIALNILARVPRQYHPILSAVSKPIRSVLSSPHFFTTRARLNTTEHLLYLKLGSLSLGTENWFAVYRKPNPIPARHVGRKSLLRFAPLPPNPVQLVGSTYAAVGPKIYAIGGTTATDLDVDDPSSEVWVLDCRSHTWERGPSMRTPRFDASVAVLDGKIYVVGGRTNESWAEVLDPGVGHWEPVTGPLDGRKEWFLDLDVVDGRICARVGKQEFRLDPETKAWEVFGYDVPYVPKDSCVVDGVLYSCDHGGSVKRFDERNGVWRALKGVAEGLPKYVCGAEVVNLEGRLVMVWAEVRFGCGNGLENGVVGLWCAEIDVRKNEDDEDWWGEVHWSEKAPLLPEGTWGLAEEDFYHSLFLYCSICLSVSL